MISQLLATIMMALGVASGTKTTSNTFYDAEKPQPKKAVETYNIDLNFTKISEWHSNGYVEEYAKYYLDDNNASTNVNSNYVLDNMIIYNTTYTFEQAANEVYYGSTVIGIYKLQNIYDGTTDFTLNLFINSIGNNRSYSRTCYLSTDSTLDQAIDQTMTQNAFNNISTVINNAEKTIISTYSSPIIPSGQNPDFDIPVPTITLAKNEIKYLIINFYMLSTPANQTTDIHLTEMNINATYIAPNYTYEIVDLPGVMFSVLSMPFAFISTAFNLTIFPNTPYQLNFANLFMVILAAFILMWLIKKVFH